MSWVFASVLTFLIVQQSAPVQYILKIKLVFGTQPN